MLAGRWRWLGWHWGDWAAIASGCDLNIPRQSAVWWDPLRSICHNGTVSQHLGPPPNKGHLSVARLAKYWYVACQSAELKGKPLARTILGIPVVFFRNREGLASALLDRCPHRNVPLSLGSIARAGNIQCAYHGWQFDGQGQCQLVPGLMDGAATKERRCPHVEVCEQAGLV